MAKKSGKAPSLEKTWIEASAEDAVQALSAAGDAAGDLVDAWVEAKNAAAVAEAADRGSGPGRKAARRALNVLKARGVAIPERKRLGKLVSGSGTTVEAWMMSPDPSGTELFAISKRTATDRGSQCMVFLHQLAGLVKIENRSLSQSQMKEYLAKVLPNAGYAAVSVPVDWARHRIQAARDSHAKRGAPEPMGLTTADALLQPVPKEAPPHPLDAEGLELSQDDAKELASDSGKLHRLPEFRAWVPSQVAIQELLIQVGQKLGPQDKPDHSEITKHLEEEVSAATDRYFSPEARSELLGRMQDAALSVLSRSGEQAALEVVAAMKVIENAGLITDPPREIPFLRAFFEKAVSMMAAQSGGSLRIPVPNTLETNVVDAPEEPDAPTET